ncbi:hypothetical protein BBP00_00004238 [Phytophthora kernoviae]|uniref:Protein kinase domain-containing protein n=1 Tax=Phytophthora kernoviae TaxID=325452 RepID=A0A3F2RT85_9STRA|nr:hypothetical protein BBP00_00004238 [Phytophthora kernoviae]
MRAVAYVSGCDFSGIVAQFKPDELEINCDNIGQLEMGEFIGSGLWRKAYKATWNGRDVVVKRVSDYGLSQPNVMYRHVKEAAAIFLIRNDANIVGLVGWCNLTIMPEYIPTNLDMLLHGTRDLVSVKRTLELARDAARGLVQVHNVSGGPLVHGDIKCEQFLLGDDGVLRLNDFNYVMYAGPRIVNGTVTSEKCPFHFPVAPKSRWHSPEEIKQLPLDEKIDIYGLSIVMWAMKSRRRPYQAIDMDEAWEGIPKGLRPPVSEMNDYPQAMQDLIIRGWDHDPKKRPTAMEMAEEVDRILQQYKEE